MHTDAPHLPPDPHDGADDSLRALVGDDLAAFAARVGPVDDQVADRHLVRIGQASAEGSELARRRARAASGARTVRRTVGWSAAGVALLVGGATGLASAELLPRPAAQVAASVTEALGLPVPHSVQVAAGRLPAVIEPGAPGDAADDGVEGTGGDDGTGGDEVLVAGPAAPTGAGAGGNAGTTAPTTGPSATPGSSPGAMSSSPEANPTAAGDRPARPAPTTTVPAPADPPCPSGAAGGGGSPATVDDGDDAVTQEPPTTPTAAAESDETPTATTEPATTEPAPGSATTGPTPPPTTDAPPATTTPTTTPPEGDDCEGTTPPSDVDDDGPGDGSGGSGGGVGLPAAFDVTPPEG